MDTIALEAALLDLVLNARQVVAGADDGEIILEARVVTLSHYRSAFRREAASGECVCIDCMDNGPGFPAHEWRGHEIWFVRKSSDLGRG